MRHAGLAARVARLAAKARPNILPSVLITRYPENAPETTITAIRTLSGAVVARNAGEALPALLERAGRGIWMAVYPL